MKRILTLLTIFLSFNCLFVDAQQAESIDYFENQCKRGAEVQKIKVPFPVISFPKASLIGGTGNPMIPFQANGRPVYYEEVAILAIPANMMKNGLDTSNFKYDLL